VMVADRPYGEFYDFYSVGPEYFGFTLVSISAASRTTSLVLTCERSCVTQRLISKAVLNCFRVKSWRASSCPLAGIKSGGFAWNLVLDAFIKICREDPDLDERVQKNSDNLRRDQVHLHCWEQDEIFWTSTIVQR
jgi:hypothetical protein